MVEPSKIKTLFPLSDDSPVILPSLCFGKRHKDIKCIRCLKNCPPEAIRWSGSLGTPQIDWEKCTDCSICLSLCPTYAFESQKEETPLLLKEIEKSLTSSKEIGWACSSYLRDEGYSYPSVIEVSCLARADESILAATVARGAKKVWLNRKACAACKFSSGEKVAFKSVKRANRLLSLFGQNPVEFCIDFPPKVKRKPLKYGTKPRGENLSRRDFFKQLREGPPESTLRTAQKNEETLSLKALVRTSKVPPSRRLLLDSLKELGRPNPVTANARGLPFGVVEIDEKCDFCELCVLLCPTAALIKEGGDSGGESGIYFRAAHCTKCGLCQKACPERAVHFGSEVHLEEILTEGKALLKEIPKKICNQCGDTLLSSEKSDLCSWCKREEELDLELSPAHIRSP